MNNVTSRIWTKTDLTLAGIAFGLSMGLYLWSMSPSVGLLDAGEFIVAAKHFGVPHPTGYPLWTLLTWLFLLVPIGNVAWQAALFSGICGALSVALCAATLSSLQRWYAGPRPETRSLASTMVTLSVSMMLALSESMWSQAVIVEVYTLHSLLIGIFLALCYSWIRNGMRERTLLAAIFTLALAISNHHLAMALAPLPFLLLLFLKRSEMMEWVGGGLVALAVVYHGFAHISGEASLIKISYRLYWCLGLGLAFLLLIRKSRLRWRLILLVPVMVVAGLLPYAYMPLASATNPPMNWAYTRETKGFFESINRSQYAGTLAEQSQKTLGLMLGVQMPKPSGGAFATTTRSRIPDYTKSQKAILWVEFFGKQQMIRAFTWIGIIGYLSSVFLVLRHPPAARTWLYFLHLAFAAAAFLQPISSSAGTDSETWWLQMPYHTYTNYIFALLAGVGLSLIVRHLSARLAVVGRLSPVLLLLPAITFFNNEASSNQRGRLFGWMFGYDLLKDLPHGSVVVGGSDPGRFIPTYMIFGEGPQPESFKRVPAFDRRDLYVITQNALVDGHYLKYLRDQYSTARPAAEGAFQEWLGRRDAYPQTALDFPSDEEISALIEGIRKTGTMGGASIAADGFWHHSAVFKLLWEKNKDKHEFYIEESVPMLWTYDYAIPSGLIYRLSPTKLDAIPADAVEADFKFWEDYKTRLLSNPSYLKDLDAKRSFSMLRTATANIYRHRGMNKEAMRASFEALELWPANVNLINTISQTLWDHGDFDKIIDLFDLALEEDPNNLGAWRARFIAEQRRDAEPRIQELRNGLAETPSSREAHLKLIDLYGSVGEPKKADELIASAVSRFPDDIDLLNSLIDYYTQARTLAKGLAIAERLAIIKPDNLSYQMLYIKALYYNQRQDAFYAALEQAFKRNEENLRKTLKADPFFIIFADDPRFQSIVSQQSEPAAVY